MTITAEQCRAGRALLVMDQISLATAAHVARGTLIDFESGKRKPNRNNLEAIERALAEKGVRFLERAAAGQRIIGVEIVLRTVDEASQALEPVEMPVTIKAKPATAQDVKKALPPKPASWTTARRGVVRRAITSHPGWRAYAASFQPPLKIEQLSRKAEVKKVCVALGIDVAAVV